MIEAQRFEAHTKMVQEADGRWTPVADDDPRAKDATAEVAYSVVVIEGVHYAVDPQEAARWIPANCDWLD